MIYLQQICSPPQKSTKDFEVLTLFNILKEFIVLGPLGARGAGEDSGWDNEGRQGEGYEYYKMPLFKTCRFVLVFT